MSMGQSSEIDRAKNGRRGRPGGSRSRAAACEVRMLEPRVVPSGAAVGGINTHQFRTASPQQAGDPVILNFSGYQWNANYNWSKDSGPYINGQLWSPQNATVDSNGYLHLYLRKERIDGEQKFASADVSLVATSSGQPFNPGYGTYLITAKTSSSAQSFDQFAKDPLAIFGAFTYQNVYGVARVEGRKITGLPPAVIAQIAPGMSLDGNLGGSGDPIFQPGTRVDRVEGDTVILNKDAKASGEHTVYFTDNTLVNRKRELDMLEVSRFGERNRTTNGQFVLQPTDPKDGGSWTNIKPITLQDNGVITVEMIWTNAQTPVDFKVFYGDYRTLNSLPSVPNISYTSPANQNRFVPNSSYQTFHLNLWQASWQFNRNGNGDKANPAEVTVMNFLYSPQTA